jgi:polyisoprenoid-binding protein YceI
MSTWTIDPAHTDIAFKAKHMMITTVRGRFDQVEGSLDLDENAPGLSGGEIRVAAASLSTGFGARDEHLRSVDFFDAEHHPWIVFRATSVTPTRAGRFDVIGDVTIRGTTVPVRFEVTYLGAVTGMRGGRHAALTATATVNRKDWGLTWNMALEAGGVLVGTEVTLEIEVAADEMADAGVRTEDAAA